MADIVVHKNRTNVLRVSLGMDVSLDTFTSEIRAEANNSSTLYGTYVCNFLTDGTDGELVLTLDDSEVLSANPVLADVKKGYMDIRRLSGGEPYPVFNAPIKVVFQDTVTE